MKTLLKLPFLSAFLVSATVSHSATLTATWVDDDPTDFFEATGFVIEFDDSNQNERFSFDELVSFSGWTRTFSDIRFYDTIVTVPDSDFTDFSGSLAVAPSSWFFDGFVVSPASANQQPTSISAGIDTWSYSIDLSEGNSDTAVVPTPAALPLMLSSLIALGLLMKRRRNR